MKKRLIYCCTAICLITSACVLFCVKNSSKTLLERSIEIMAHGEKNDGALYYNEQYSLFCCGPGNVRDCDDYPEMIKCK